jgi:mannose/cellobiose epimerase-like protein (N-acyl-D-glucosamine 2-epimerase family)
MIEKHIDGKWFRRSLVQDNLAHWLAAAPTENGFYRATLDRQWRPAEKQTGTLVSQCRLLFVLASGYEVTGDEAYLQAVRKGADFLLDHFRDGEYAGWFWSVDPEGKVLDPSKSSYGHAFVIFGLGHAYRATGDQRYKSAALDTWTTVKTSLRDQHGGLRNSTTRDFGQVRGGNTQNPIMHTFEALLALHQATRSEEIYADMTELAEFVFGRLYQPEGGYLPEGYDADWKPLAIDRRGYVDVGHQFEWAYLLSRAVDAGLDRGYLDIGNRLIDYGMKSGYDRANGGIFPRGNYQGGLLDGQGKGWWEQCELLRALMHYAALRGREDLWPAFDQSLAFVKRYFIDPDYGGWYGGYDPANFPPAGRRADKASTWKVGYHDTGMYLEALRLSGGLKAR